MPRKQLDELELEELIQMAKADVKPSIIADELDVHVSTVYRIIAQEGIRENKQDAEATEIIERYQSGERVQVLANTMGISTYKLYDVLHAHGIELRRQQTLEVDEDEADLIVQLYQEGRSLSTIRKETGRSTTFIYKTLDERGIPRRSKTGKWRVVDTW